MTTINIVDTGLAGQTGTGNFVGANTPTLITPTLGATTATSIVFSPTTNGMIGTTTNDNAIAGTVGEYISSSILIGSAVAMTTTNTGYNITTISLTAGDWDVSGVVVFNPAGTTTINGIYTGISTTSTIFPTAGTGNNFTYLTMPLTTGQQQIQPVGPTRLSLSGTTTVYLLALAIFGVSTMSGYGFISARRIR
jgi:hypothetical protein